MDTIGVVAVTRGGDVNLYFLELLGSIVEAANEHRQNTTIFSIEDWAEDHSRMLRFCDGRVDGMILMAPYGFTEPMAEALRKRVPYVILHNDGPRLDVDNVDVDDEGGAYDMTKYLISLGHRSIAHFAGPTDRHGARRRLQGYRRALEEAGLPFDATLVVHGAYTDAAGRKLATEMLDSRGAGGLPTAIFCATDTIATGCMEVLSRSGVRIPDDISVTGFDGLLQSLMTMPPLTTIHQPLREMGKYAVEQLLFRVQEGSALTARAESFDEHLGSRTPEAVQTLAQPAPSPAATRVFQCELIVRGSSAPPRR
jgi:DNA-binding LacI/PurR family transcriptional regulator